MLSAHIQPVMSKIIVFVTLLFSTNLFSQTLTSIVDRNQISSNQTFTLVVSYDGSTRSDALDLSAIQQDFEVLSSSSGTNTQIVNGNRSTSTNWKLILSPKRTGNLVIPSFNLGNIYSEAVQIEVLKAGQAGSSNDPIVVELKIDQDSVRVGEQALINVKLRSQSMLTNLAGEGLKIEGYDLKPVDQQQYSEIQNGVGWVINEWTYALFPKTEGSVAIPRQMFSAIRPSSQKSSFFDSFSRRGERVIGRSEPTVIKVLPADAGNNSTQNWFPASRVSVESSWASDPSSLRVGEPITRIIEIKAESQLSAAIPPLSGSSSGASSDNTPAYKEYRDQPALEDIPSAKGITGLRRESSAIVPSQEGTLELPAQTIHWWNTRTKKWEQTLLPSESYQVLPALVDNSLSPPTQSNTSQISEESSDGLSEANVGDEWVTQTVNDPFWKWATMALILISTVQAILIFRLRKRKAPAKATAAGGYSRTESQSWRELQGALKSNDANAIRSSLIRWSEAAWPREKPHNLAVIAEKSSNTDFKNAINEIDEILFKGKSSVPRSELIGREIAVLRNSIQQPQNESPLAPLYPQSL